jgi:Predicted transcriptional regulator containing an HTH domain and an uncharacterized domain shared with the mammalian protein Schlafen
MDYKNIENYTENNRIEAKSAAGGLPESLWETYSAFANTLGGVILLGVDEMTDRALKVNLGVAKPRRMLREIFAVLGDTGRVSANILTRKNAQIIRFGIKRVIALEIPCAPKEIKPVFIGGDIYKGTYIRIGEGDYRCTKAEVEEMLNNREV